MCLIIIFSAAGPTVAVGTSKGVEISTISRDDSGTEGERDGVASGYRNGECNPVSGVVLCITQGHVVYDGFPAPAFSVRDGQPEPTAEVIGYMHLGSEDRLLPLLSHDKLVVLGEKDRLVGAPELVRPLAENVPQIIIKVLSSAHFIGLEKAEEVNLLMKEFFEK